jgi:transposase-like protein
MSRHAPALQCSDDVRNELITLSKRRTAGVGRGERVRVILACLQGKENQQVAREVGTLIPTVSKWRRRFAQRGLEGLQDGPRSGNPPTYGPAFRDRVLALREQAPFDSANWCAWGPRVSHCVRSRWAAL